MGTCDGKGALKGICSKVTWKDLAGTDIFQFINMQGSFARLLPCLCFVVWLNLVDQDDHETERQDPRRQEPGYRKPFGEHSVKGKPFQFVGTSI